jgi:hypothetical protein
LTVPVYPDYFTNCEIAQENLVIQTASSHSNSGLSEAIRVIKYHPPSLFAMSLTDRAKIILAQAEHLDAYFENHGLAYPSFDEDTLDYLPPDLQDMRWSLANHANDMKKLVRGPIVCAMDIALNVSQIGHQSLQGAED